MMRIFPVLWALGLIVCPATLYAQNVVSTAPTQNALQVSPGVDISVTFDVAMYETTINSATFLVQTTGSGGQTGTVSYDGPTQTATFAPDREFGTGEVVTVTLTAGMQSSGGTPLAGGYVWSFTITAGSGGGFISPYLSSPAADYPRALCAADVDDDGDLDLVSADNGADVISIFFNRGNGAFMPHVDYPVLEAPWSVVTGDLDGDGDLDLATANYLSFDVAVLLNHGDGLFDADTTYATYPVGERPEQICAADFDNDGDLDLATANSLSNTISILLNNGDATYAAHVQYPAGVYPYSVTPIDLDGDGDLDLAVTNGSERVELLLNYGNGVFIPWTNYPVGNVPYTCCAADLDADGDLDLAVNNIFGNDICVLLNQGNGTMAPGVFYDVGVSPTTICAADLDGDGDLDLTTANNYTADISLLANNGDGTFADDVVYSVGEQPWAIIAADLDHDGDLDLATAHYRSPGIISVLLDGCNCLPFGDANLDGRVNPLDVSIIVKFVYLQQDARAQVTGCPGDNGDWDCNGSVGPLDVSFYVNYVFKGWGSGPCDPCACASYPTGCP